MQVRDTCLFLYSQKNGSINLPINKMQISLKIYPMKVVGSIIARLGSKRLPYKNILPFEGEPLVLRGIRVLQAAQKVDEIVVSTESELIARIVAPTGVRVIERPQALARDDIPSVPVFQHLMTYTDAALHVNYNINFPLCDPSVIDDAIDLAQAHGESLSEPFAAWAQTRDCLNNYQDPWDITAYRFKSGKVGHVDVHTIEDLLAVYRESQGAESAPWISCS